MISSCAERRDQRLIGLWSNDTLDLRLSFDNDSVIDVNQLGGAKYSYSLEEGKIIFKSKDSDRSDYSSNYSISSDTLFIWYRTKTWEDKDTIELLVYKKSNASNYYEHYLNKNGLSINLPEATLARYVFDRQTLDFRIDFVNNEIKLFIDDNYVSIENLDNYLSNFKSKHDLDDPYSHSFYDYKCRLFIDKDIPIDYVLGLFPYLRKYSLNEIYFMTHEENIDPISEGFKGFRFYVNPKLINIIEEKNAR
jgi:hypothetical protein